MRRLRDQLGRRVYPVHRLDRPTSGVLLFGLSSMAASELCAAFRARRVEKIYTALVRGFVAAEGLFDSPLESKDSTLGTALTAYRRLNRVCLPHRVGRYATARYSLVTVFPKTGRTHQIRRHFAHTGHPIVGDYAHGDRYHNHFFRDHFRIRRLFLMARQLEFFHPFHLERRTIHAPVDPVIDNLLSQWDWLDGKYTHGPMRSPSTREVFPHQKRKPSNDEDW